MYARIVLIALSLGIPVSPRLQPTSARKIMARVVEQDRTRDTFVKLKMILINQRGRKRIRELTQVTKTDAAGNRKQLIRFLAPADIAGTGFLSIEYGRRSEDNWLYLPALRKTRRIAGSGKKDKFVGSEFTYEDLDDENPEVYEYALLGTETIDGFDTWLIEARPAPPWKRRESGYSRRLLWVEKAHHLVIQAKFFNKKGVHNKLFHASDIRRVPGTNKYRPYRMSMQDVRKGKKTLLEVMEIKIDQGVRDSFFSVRYLKRRR